MEFLGHTSLQYTKKYIQLERALFQRQCDEFVCKEAKTSDEAVGLVELCFENVNEIQGVHFYRKRK
jgi:hypothetical protein